METENEEKRISFKEIGQMTLGAFEGTLPNNLFITGLLLVTTAAHILEPIIYGQVIDKIIVAFAAGALSQIWSSLIIYFVAWAVIDLAGSFAKAIAQQLGYNLADRVWIKFWERTLSRVVSWDPERFTNVSLGGLAKKLDNIGSAVWRLAGTTIRDTLPPFLSVIAFYVVGSFINWQMTLISTLGVIPLFAMTFFAQRAVDKRQDAMNDSWERFLQRVIEIFSNIVPIKSFASEQRLVAQNVTLGRECMVNQSRVNLLWTFLECGTSIARFLTRFVVLVYGVWSISRGRLTPGEMITFLGMVSVLLAPFDQLLSELMRRLADTRSSFARVAPLWFQENKITSPARSVVPSQIRGELVFDRVSYQYSPNQSYALNDISLTVPAGTSLALIGHSGSGKSTLVKFINRFLDPSKGEIRIDGLNLKSFNLNTLRQAIGVVHQETVLFNASVLDNLRFAKPSATRAQIESACKQAQAHNFIKNLERGYDTIIGERGVKLSGGERQRIALARIFLLNPPILILDESTSALDSETESKLQAALQKAMRGRTTIIIAHRLSTIYLADQIAVLESGKIAELGSHDELVSNQGVYERLWRLQSGGYIK